MVVARHQQDAALRRGARVAHVLEHVAAAVHAGRLAVPHGKHAIDRALAGQVHLLRAPHRGGSQLFVHAGQELDGVGFELRLGFPQRFVQAAERRAAVARDKARGVQAGLLVAPFLHEHEAHQRLDAAEVDPAFGGRVFVVQRNAGEFVGCHERKDSG
ncbi:hypothetical protein D9M69_522960 [compost metagenome]